MMRSAAMAGLVYGLLAFAAGFAVGSLRVFWLAPWLGQGPAAIAELPVMLLISWALCRWLIARLGVDRGIKARAMMGLAGFLCLMALEFALAVLGFGVDPGAFLRGLATPVGAVGLAGQIAFALIPLVVARRSRTYSAASM